MSEDQEKPKLYTLPLQYVCEIIEEAEAQISVTRDIVKDLLGSPDENVKITSMLVKLLWLNYAILEVVTEAVEEPAYHTNEKTGEDEYMLTEEELMNLQNYVVARYYTKGQLNKLSYSVTLN